MTIPTNLERKAMSARYSPPKIIIKWVVLQMGKIVYESTAPGLCEQFIHVNQLRGAYKKPIYGK